MTEQSPDELGTLVTATVENDVLILRVVPRQIRDAETSYALRDEMTSLVDVHGSRHAVIDLSAVDFIGSIGLLALLGVRRRLNEAGGRIVICNIAGLIREMLAACRLISSDASRPAVFEAAATREAALALLADGG